MRTGDIIEQCGCRYLLLGCEPPISVDFSTVVLVLRGSKFKNIYLYSVILLKDKNYQKAIQNGAFFKLPEVEIRSFKVVSHVDIEEYKVDLLKRQLLDRKFSFNSIEDIKNQYKAVCLKYFNQICDRLKDIPLGQKYIIKQTNRVLQYVGIHPTGSLVFQENGLALEYDVENDLLKEFCALPMSEDDKIDYQFFILKPCGTLYYTYDEFRKKVGMK